MKIPLLLIGFGYAATIIGLIDAVPRHIVDPNWPAHAQTHVYQALIWVVGFNAACLAILALPFRRMEKWSWWVVLASGFFIYGGYWLPEPITHGGAPGIIDDIFFATAWILQICGLAMSWKHFQNKATSSSYNRI